MFMFILPDILFVDICLLLFTFVYIFTFKVFDLCLLKIILPKYTVKQMFALAYFALFTNTCASCKKTISLHAILSSFNLYFEITKSFLQDNIFDHKKMYFRKCKGRSKYIQSFHIIKKSI